MNKSTLKTRIILAALSLCVIATAAVPVAAADHAGWDCYGVSGTAEVCVARSLQTGYDCFLKIDVPGHEKGYCYII